MYIRMHIHIYIYVLICIYIYMYVYVRQGCGVPVSLPSHCKVVLAGYLYGNRRVALLAVLGGAFVCISLYIYMCVYIYIYICVCVCVMQGGKVAVSIPSPCGDAFGRVVSSMGTGVLHCGQSR